MFLTIYQFQSLRLFYFSNQAEIEIMKNLYHSYACILFLLICAAVCSPSPVQATSRREILNAAEKEMIQKYKFWMNKSKFGPVLFNYIKTHLESGSESDAYKAVFMIRQLSKKDQKQFVKPTMDKVVDWFTDASFLEENNIPVQYPNAIETRSSSMLINEALHTLSYTRDKEAMRFLVDLVHPVEQWKFPWKDKFLNAVEKMPDKQRFIYDLREKSFGAIFQPLDVYGKKRLDDIYRIISRFPDEDPLKHEMLKHYETWKKIYNGKVNAQRLAK